MNILRRIVAALMSFLTGVPELTPRQKAKLEEMEKEHAEWIRTQLANHPGGSGRKL